MKVAVLFARRDSIYKTMPDVDVWDADRDARNFDGDVPVVAHPPCRAWSALSHMAKPRHDEKDLARFAVRIVRQNGGVLEHPISSKLWPDQGLPEMGSRDEFGGFTIVVPQFWFGHRATKNTRLYVCGCDRTDVPEIPLVLGEAPCVVTTSKRKCMTPPSQWKERLGPKEKEGTPTAFAKWLVELASRCSPVLALGCPE